MPTKLENLKKLYGENNPRYIKVKEEYENSIEVNYSKLRDSYITLKNNIKEIKEAQIRIEKKLDALKVYLQDKQ